MSGVNCVAYMDELGLSSVNGDYIFSGENHCGITTSPFYHMRYSRKMMLLVLL